MASEEGSEGGEGEEGGRLGAGEDERLVDLELEWEEERLVDDVGGEGSR